MAKKLNKCPICGDDHIPEGAELRAYEGRIIWAYPGETLILARHNVSNWGEVTKKWAQRRKDSKLEEAYKQLLLKPKSKKALREIREWRAEQLFEMATDHSRGIERIKATDQLLREFTGEPEPEVVKPRQPSKKKVEPEKVNIVVSETPKPSYILEPIKPVKRTDPWDLLDNDELWEEPAPVEPEPEPERIGAVFIVLPNGEIVPEKKRKPVNPYLIKSLSG